MFQCFYCMLLFNGKEVEFFMNVKCVLMNVNYILSLNEVWFVPSASGDMGHGHGLSRKYLVFTCWWEIGKLWNNAMVLIINNAIWQFLAKIW